MHPRDVYHPKMLKELRRLAELPFQWGEIERLEFPYYKCVYKTHTWMKELTINEPTHSSDFTGNIANVAWLKEGPKVVKVTEQQYTVLSKVDVNLTLREVTLPYPTVMVVMPPGKMHKHCLVHRYNEDLMICVSISHNNHNDIVTVVGHHDDILVEESLEKYGPECADITEETSATLRVAVNILLALTNFGHQSELLLPKEVETDKSIIRKKRGTEAAARAEDRLKIAPVLVKFDREVVLHRDRRSEPSEPTGRKTCFHWVRGHWKSQPYGEGRTLRKRIYIAPYMVNADSLTVNPIDTLTTYRTRDQRAENNSAQVGATSTSAGQAAASPSADATKAT